MVTSIGFLSTEWSGDQTAGLYITRVCRWQWRREKRRRACLPDPCWTVSLQRFGFEPKEVVGGEALFQGCLGWFQASLQSARIAVSRPATSLTILSVFL